MDPLGPFQETLPRTLPRAQSITLHFCCFHGHSLARIFEIDLNCKLYRQQSTRRLVREKCRSHGGLDCGPLMKNPTGGVKLNHPHMMNHPCRLHFGESLTQSSQIHVQYPRNSHITASRCHSLFLYVKNYKAFRTFLP